MRGCAMVLREGVDPCNGILWWRGQHRQVRSFHCAGRQAGRERLRLSCCRVKQRDRQRGSWEMTGVERKKMQHHLLCKSGYTIHTHTHTHTQYNGSSQHHHHQQQHQKVHSRPQRTGCRAGEAVLRGVSSPVGRDRRPLQRLRRAPAGGVPAKRFWSASGPGAGVDRAGGRCESANSLQITWP